MKLKQRFQTLVKGYKRIRLPKLASADKLKSVGKRFSRIGRPTLLTLGAVLLLAAAVVVGRLYTTAQLSTEASEQTGASLDSVLREAYRRVNSGDTFAAITLLENETKRGRDIDWLHELHYELGLIYSGLEKNELALRQFEIAHAEAQTQFELARALLEVGRLAERTGESEKALATYRRYLDISGAVEATDPDLIKEIERRVETLEDSLEA
ncbi:MAG: tetratricopeptide repeat protein [Candidatus Saccharimonadales bacterium]